MFKWGKSDPGWTSFRDTFKINSLWAHKHSSARTHNSNLGLCFFLLFSFVIVSRVCLDYDGSKHWFRAGHLDREISNLKKRARLHFGPQLSWTEKTLEHWNQWCSKCKFKRKLTMSIRLICIFDYRSVFFTFISFSAIQIQHWRISSRKSLGPVSIHDQEISAATKQHLIKEMNIHVLPTTHRTELPNSPLPGIPIGLMMLTWTDFVDHHLIFSQKPVACSIALNAHGLMFSFF